MDFKSSRFQSQETQQGPGSESPQQSTSHLESAGLGVPAGPLAEFRCFGFGAGKLERSQFPNLDRFHMVIFYIYDS